MAMFTVNQELTDDKIMSVIYCAPSYLVLCLKEIIVVINS